VFLFDRAVNGPDGQGARATGARMCTIRVPIVAARAPYVGAFLEKRGYSALCARLLSQPTFLPARQAKSGPEKE
jgi:hypothetical protein